MTGILRSILRINFNVRIHGYRLIFIIFSTFSFFQILNEFSLLLHSVQFSFYFIFSIPIFTWFSYDLIQLISRTTTDVIRSEEARVNAESYSIPIANSIASLVKKWNHLSRLWGIYHSETQSCKLSEWY